MEAVIGWVALYLAAGVASILRFDAKVDPLDLDEEKVLVVVMVAIWPLIAWAMLLDALERFIEGLDD